MATDVLSGYTGNIMLNTEARLGEDTIGPGLADDLQKFYEKTDSYADRAKCLELINSIRLGDAAQNEASKRPYSAFPAVGMEHAKNFLSPYQTSYNRDYPLKQPIDTLAMRPMTSHGFPPQEGPGALTHYTEEYKGKRTRPMTPLRPGSASGNRANNPHPSQSFLVWKYPHRGYAESEGAMWSEQLTDEKMNQVHKRLCQSTYQNDYLGVPQGFELKSAYTLPPDWKENIPYTLDSVKRYCYQERPQPEQLQLPVSRYGSNTKKQIAACGTVPTASHRHMHIRNRTTYDRHYNDNADNVTLQVRQLGHKLGAEALRKYYDSAKGEDRLMAKQLVEAYSGQKVTPTPQPTPQPPQMGRPPSGAARAGVRFSHRANVPACTPITAPAYPETGLPKAPSSRMSFNVYSPPQLLH